MNVLKKVLSEDWDYVNLYPLADIHLGSGHFAKTEFEAHLKKIEEDERAVVILNGDLINNAIKTSVSDIYGEKLTPEESIEQLKKYLWPIRHKIIGATTGNHEERTYKEVGIDVVKYICVSLGIAEIYSPTSNVIFLSFGKNRGRSGVYNTFTIYHTHGAGGGGTIGAKSNKVRKLSQMIQADIYIHSHTHSPIIFKEDYILTNASNKGVKKVSRLFINTNAYEGFGGYGEKLGLTPSNLEFIVVRLSADKKGNKIMKAFL